jgi:hypothetical protein
VKPPIRKAQPEKPAKVQGVDPARFVSESHNFDFRRPKRKVVSRYSKPK